MTPAARAERLVAASVIIPAYNQAEHLAPCLAAVHVARVPDVEVIVVDDASTDGTVEIARAMGAQVVRSARNRGPAAARNLGARHARGAVLIFIDADVVVAPNAIRRVLQVLRGAPEIDAVFGSYNARPSARSVVSEYRNLLHHFTHQQAHADATTFWAGLGAVRRSAFERVGGFDEGSQLYYIEDVELGWRLRQSGSRIRLDKDLLATHRKRWRLWDMVRIDTLRRARPWSHLILRGDALIDDLNVKTSQRVAVALSTGGAALLPVSAFAGEALTVAGAAFVVALALSAPFFRFLSATRGMPFAVASVPLHLLYHLSCAAGFAIAFCERLAAPVAHGVARHGSDAPASYQSAALEK